MTDKLTQEGKIQRRYEAIIDQEHGCDTCIPKLEGLVQLTGIRPSDELLRKIYLTSLEERSTVVGREKLKNFSKKYGLAELVTEGEIQGIYGRFLDEGDIHYVEDAVEVSGVTPVLNEEQVRSAYIKAFQKGVCASIISSFQRLSGVKPKIPEHLVQEKYAEYFSREYPMSLLKEIKEVTGVVPVLDPIKVKERFRTLLEREDMRSASELKNVLDVDFPEDVISDLYVSMVENGRFGSLDRLMNATRITPKWELLENKYRAFLDEHDFAGARMLKKNFGVCLKLNESEVQAIYKSFSGAPSMYEIKDVIELTGVSPEEDIVQRWYVSLIGGGSFDRLNEFRDFTGIKPSEETLGSLGEL